jgi:hypothetical protein
MIEPTSRGVLDSRMRGEDSGGPASERREKWTMNGVTEGFLFAQALDQ